MAAEDAFDGHMSCLSCRVQEFEFCKAQGSLSIRNAVLPHATGKPKPKLG